MIPSCSSKKNLLRCSCLKRCPRINIPKRLSRIGNSLLDAGVKVSLYIKSSDSDTSAFLFTYNRSTNIKIKFLKVVFRYLSKKKRNNADTSQRRKKDANLFLASGLVPISANNTAIQTVWWIESLFLKIYLYIFDNAYFRNM